MNIHRLFLLISLYCPCLKNKFSLYLHYILCENFNFGLFMIVQECIDPYGKLIN